MLTKQNPQITEAAAKLVELSEDDRSRMIADDREKARRDYAAGINSAKAEGRMEERLSIARKMLDRNLPIQEIMEDTGLSNEQIQSLIH